MTLEGLRIRKAEMDDLNAIKCLADANRATLGFVLRPAIVDSIHRNWLLVAELPNTGVVGFTHYRHRQDSQTTLYQICVDQDYRGQGIGRTLILTLREEAIMLGKANIRLKAPMNIPANAFYQAVCFQLVGTEVGKTRDLNLWSYELSCQEQNT